MMTGRRIRMLIPVNQNIDEYKDDFYKGLTLRQSVISLVTVAVGVLVYLALTGLFHLPQSLALIYDTAGGFPDRRIWFPEDPWHEHSRISQEKGSSEGEKQLCIYSADAVWRRIAEWKIKGGARHRIRKEKADGKGKQRSCIWKQRIAYGIWDIAEEEMQLT